jgi:hypothetical protein
MFNGYLKIVSFILDKCKEKEEALNRFQKEATSKDALAAKLTEEVSWLTTVKEELQGQLEESKKALNQYLQQAAASDALAARLTEEVRWLTADRKELLCQIDLARYRVLFLKHSISAY